MGTVRKDVIIGILVSLFATAAGAFIYLEYFSRYGFFETLDLIKQGDLYGKVIAIAAIPNLLVFFVYLKKNQENRAKGVLMGTILIAFFSFALKLL